jgi:hypothetical protein
MFDNILNWFLAFDFTGRMGLMLYWLPVAVCAQGYLARTIKRYRDCVAARNAGNHFHSDTVGTLIGRAIATFCPVINLLAAICDLGPKLLGGFFARIGKMFDQPLVRQAAPKSSKP